MSELLTDEAIQKGFIAIMVDAGWVWDDGLNPSFITERVVTFITGIVNAERRAERERIIEVIRERAIEHIGSNGTPALTLADLADELEGPDKRTPNGATYKPGDRVRAVLTVEGVVTAENSTAPEALCIRFGDNYYEYLPNHMVERAEVTVLEPAIPDEPPVGSVVEFPSNDDPGGVGYVAQREGGSIWVVAGVSSQEFDWPELNQEYGVDFTVLKRGGE